ncbi:hypothetical protein NDU88_005291 [Pleurodeles waltl]|uniref:Uncharacterized protein n=1 Tax=Pleurodeles waltl TaxID=8319 RepID=A0AAV7VMT3_PLEWA|nr:hypothetical protein NDU88_005291 [Pleurodeles waltl]
MPRGRATGNPLSNPDRQLLFFEALHQQKHPPVKDPKDPPPHSHTITGNMEEGPQGASMDRILQEISAVGRKLEGMDSAMIVLTAETRSMCLEIAGFQSQISGLDQRVATVETQVASWTDNGQELMHLRSKLTDLEDRSRRNNICLMGFPEGIEGTDLTSFLRDTLPKLTDTTFDPPLEFERVHRLGPKRQDGKGLPRSIIACLLRQCQARQLLQTARAQGPLKLCTTEIQLSADFSKETVDRRRAFLSLRPRLHHLDVKFGLFEPARMWITTNGDSRTFFDPEDLRTFLDKLQEQAQPMETTTLPLQDIQGIPSETNHPEAIFNPERGTTMDPQPRGRDLERRTKSHDDRGQVLQAVAMYTQMSDRDKSAPL